MQISKCVDDCAKRVACVVCQESLCYRCDNGRCLLVIICLMGNSFVVGAMVVLGRACGL